MVRRRTWIVIRSSRADWIWFRFSHYLHSRCGIVTGADGSQSRAVSTGNRSAQLLLAEQALYKAVTAEDEFHICFVALFCDEHFRHQSCRGGQFDVTDNASFPHKNGNEQKNSFLNIVTPEQMSKNHEREEL
ncbi:hypothetical protein scyTo_0020237 [Scyliorhinus torazame]|uniref:Uncharacterized protein n=1 Tax=Scyliorhinus torazame TaxID=75743 RepID=A0A401Q2S8_SCYTO|nr:hypothetical protein [Scyliorhinus torazame]